MMQRRFGWFLSMLALLLILTGCTLPFGFSFDDVIPKWGNDPTETLPPPSTWTPTERPPTAFQTLTPTSPSVPTVTSDVPLTPTEIPATEEPTPTSEDITATPSSEVVSTEETAEVDVTPTSQMGEISGEVVFPAPQSEIPPFRVVAFDQDSDLYYYTVTRMAQPSFSLSGLPPGDYVMVAYIIPAPGNVQPDWVGGYSEAVLCGLGDECTDHALVVITVQAGQVVEDIQVGDWYAEPGTYPNDPTNQ